MSEALLEYCDSRGLDLRIDAEAGVLRGVKVLGLASRNGRVYPAETLLKAMPLYEGAKVNVNHPQGNPRGPRDYRDRIGMIRNVAAQPDAGLFADFHFNPKHPLAEQLAWDARHAPENVGFSHNVEARVARRGQELIVEEILTVQGVDLVADPATTCGLFEDLQQTQLGWSWEALNASDLQTRRPDLVVAITQTVREELNAARGEIEGLRLAEAGRERELRILALLREHGLPQPETETPWGKALVSETFWRSLLAAPDETTLARQISERAQLIERVGAFGAPRDAGRYSGPRSRDQFQVDMTFHDSSAEAFVRAIT
jgi:hypothetical protein